MSPSIVEKGCLVIVLSALFTLCLICTKCEAKDHKLELQKGKCIARLEASGEPLYYLCPRANESEKKRYCCDLDKCCDYKEKQKQMEQQYKITQPMNYGYIGKNVIGSALKVLLWIVCLIILLIVGCCCLTFFLCRKKKLFQGGIFSSPLPAQPPGPSPYAAPTNPYMAYQWPPETSNNVPPPPAYPAPSYPPYPNSNNQPPFNPNFKQ